MEKSHVSGVAKDKNVARLALVGLADEPGIAFKIFSLLAKNRINVDIILQSIGRDSSKDISFTVARGDTERAKALLEERERAYAEQSRLNDAAAQGGLQDALALKMEREQAVAAVAKALKNYETKFGRGGTMPLRG